MATDHDARQFVAGGISGITGTLCYVLAISVPAGQTGTYVLAMAWPILSIVFILCLFRFIEISKPGITNQLALVFGCLAFAMVATMISAQLAVRAGIQEYLASETATERDLLNTVQRAVRLVDMGIDVAWDLFIGTALIFLSLALTRHNDFGPRWGIPAALLSILLIVLNVFTFPWPPDTRGLIDVGPAIGLYIIALSARLLQLGIRMRRSAVLDKS